MSHLVKTSLDLSKCKHLLTRRGNLSLTKTRRWIKKILGKKSRVVIGKDRTITATVPDWTWAMENKPVCCNRCGALAVDDPPLCCPYCQTKVL